MIIFAVADINVKDSSTSYLHLFFVPKQRNRNLKLANNKDSVSIFKFM